MSNVEHIIDEATKIRQHWLADPVAFSVDALGVEPWDDGTDDSQAAVLRTCAKNKLVATRSGHKTGKSKSASILALWAYVLFDLSRVILTAPTFRQVREVLWREISALYRSARMPLGGKLFDSPMAGLRHPAGNEVLGLSTDDPDRFSGISGPNVFYLADEAPGVAESIFDAIHGNRAGGAWLWMFGNPTQLSGTFFEAFHGLSDQYKTHHISSEAVAQMNAIARIPGLATMDWVHERRRAWRPCDTHPMYAVRVLGNFPPSGLNAVVTLIAWEAARKRWDALGFGTSEDDILRAHRELARAGVPLTVGFDVARFGDDSCVLAPRRGPVIFPLVSAGSMDSKQAAAWCRGHVRRWAIDWRIFGKPTVNVDAIGVGAGVYDELAVVPDKPAELHLHAVAIQSSETADDSDEYHNLKAQMWFGTSTWLRTEGAVAPDDELRVDLLAPQYKFDSRGRLQVESKDDVKARLGRSPDRGDAVVLSTYSGGSYALQGFTLRGL